MSVVLTTVDDDYGSDRQIAQLRIPPHSIEAESSVLGGLLLDNSAWDRVNDLLAEGDFYRYEHRLVYGALIGSMPIIVANSMTLLLAALVLRLKIVEECNRE